MAVNLEQIRSLLMPGLEQVIDYGALFRQVAGIPNEIFMPITTIDGPTIVYNPESCEVALPYVITRRAVPDNLYQTVQWGAPVSVNFAQLRDLLMPALYVAQGQMGGELDMWIDNATDSLMIQHMRPNGIQARVAVTHGALCNDARTAFHAAIQRLRDSMGTLPGAMDYRAQQNAMGKTPQEKGMELLRENLTPTQLAEFNTMSHFMVIGSDSGMPYRIRRGRSMNIDEFDLKGKQLATLCFMPKGGLVDGDVMLAQKIALETNETETRKVANRVPNAAPANQYRYAQPGALADGLFCNNTYQQQPTPQQYAQQNMLAQQQNMLVLAQQQQQALQNTYVSTVNTIAMNINPGYVGYGGGAGGIANANSGYNELRPGVPQGDITPLRALRPGTPDNDINPAFAGTTTTVPVTTEWSRRFRGLWR